MLIVMEKVAEMLFEGCFLCLILVRSTKFVMSIKWRLKYEFES